MIDYLIKVKDFHWLPFNLWKYKRAFCVMYVSHGLDSCADEYNLEGGFSKPNTYYVGSYYLFNFVRLFLTLTMFSKHDKISHQLEGLWLFYQSIVGSQIMYTVYSIVLNNTSFIFSMYYTFEPFNKSNEMAIHKLVLPKLWKLSVLDLKSSEM